MAFSMIMKSYLFIHECSHGVESIFLKSIHLNVMIYIKNSSFEQQLNTIVQQKDYKSLQVTILLQTHHLFKWLACLFIAKEPQVRHKRAACGSGVCVSKPLIYK